MPYKRTDHVPLPPPDARVVTTACDYCVVGCGYKAYTWPEGREGGPRADQNAFGHRLSGAGALRSMGEP